jgi:(E)-4-hydroxy-3-methylbut-2-enyl-diphosphate synthase
MLAEKCDYPLHVGITEAGTLETGTIKSSVGIGAILLTGIGDTIRVSLTADPVHEVRVGQKILTSCALKKDGLEVISCPTCGRCQIDMIPLAESIEAKTRHIKTPLKVAVMGCPVNGPGEAAAADVGIAGGKGKAMLIKKGEVIRTAPESELETMLLDEIESMTGEKIERD